MDDRTEDSLGAGRWRTVLAIDHDPKAVEVYRANVAAERVECGNVADFDCRIGADVIVGGPPCQPFSHAGERRGDDDERDCVPDFIACVERELPRMFLMEQVPGFTTFDEGRYMQRTVAALMAAGYDVAVKSLDAVNFGVPQFRERVWFWGVRRDLPEVIARRRWPRPTHAWPWPDQPCMFGGDLLPAVVVGQALGLEVYGGGSNHEYNRRARRLTDEPSTTLSLCNGNDHPFVASEYLGEFVGLKAGIQEYRWSKAMLEKHPPASPASPAPTVQAKWYKGGAEGLVEIKSKQKRTTRGVDEPSPTLGGDSRHQLSVRRLTPDECARLQSLPDDFAWPASVAKTHRYRIIGNGWASLIAKRLGEAFAEADPASRTVIDLFCGGGCGAVGWHGRAWEFLP